MKRYKRTPVVDYARKVLGTARKEMKMEKELRSFGKPVKGGFVMTTGDLQRYFRSKLKKK